MQRLFAFVFFASLFFLFTPEAHAHEAYVLTHNEFQQGLSIVTQNPLAPLMNTSNWEISASITVSIMFLYLLGIFWSTTPWAGILDRAVKKARVVGPLIIRLAMSSSFFFAAMSNSLLGPELQLSTLPEGQIIRIILFGLSLMIFFGFLTEIAAAIGFVVFFYATSKFQWYMITYANYFGELLVLLLFGSRFLSFDLYLFGKKALTKGLEKLRFLEIPIVRILYGIALIYAGWTIKFAHQGLSIAVYNQYHLINFFHASPEFIAAGAGLSEISIGFFILIGFQQRLTTIISLIFITLSLLYFREMLWPHLMLYGISFSLIINSADPFTIDRYLVPFVKKLFKKKK